MLLKPETPADEMMVLSYHKYKTFTFIWDPLFLFDGKDTSKHVSYQRVTFYFSRNVEERAARA